MKDDRDSIDEMLDIWGRELPDLDLVTEGIVERIQHLNFTLRKMLEETLEGHDLSHGEWGLLGQLRRGGPPYRSTPGKLARRQGLSTGAMTNRIDRLEQAGFVRRLPDPDDRRSILVELTDRGRVVWEESVGTQAAKEALVADALDAREKDALNTLLRRLVRSTDAVYGPWGKKHDPA